MTDGLFKYTIFNLVELLNSVWLETGRTFFISVVKDKWKFQRKLAPVIFINVNTFRFVNFTLTKKNKLEQHIDESLTMEIVKPFSSNFLKQKHKT